MQISISAKDYFRMIKDVPFTALDAFKFAAQFTTSDFFTFPAKTTLNVSCTSPPSVSKDSPNFLSFEESSTCGKQQLKLGRPLNYHQIQPQTNFCTRVNESSAVLRVVGRLAQGEEERKRKRFHECHNPVEMSIRVDQIKNYLKTNDVYEFKAQIGSGMF